MATPTTASFANFRVLLGDGAETPTYSAPCGFLSRSFSLTKDLSDTLLPDCSDEDAIAWIARDAISRSGSISGEGLLASESVETWLDAYDASTPVSVKIEMEFTSKTVTWTGDFHIDSFEASGSRGERTTANISMQSDGALTRVVT